MRIYCGRNDLIACSRYHFIFNAISHSRCDPTDLFRLTHHGGKKTLTIMQSYGRRQEVMVAYKRIAPQLTPQACWYRILSEAVKKYLNGRQLHPPDCVSSLV